MGPVLLVFKNRPKSLITELHRIKGTYTVEEVKDDRATHRIGTNDYLVSDGIYCCGKDFIRGTNFKFQKVAYLFVVMWNEDDFGYAQVRHAMYRLNRFMGDVEARYCTVITRHRN